MKSIAQILFIVTLLILAGDCTPAQKSESTTMILAHRASSGLWPQNSRNAVVNSIKAASKGDLKGKFHGIELDIVLTKDGVPVLSHEPWVHKSLCVQSDGSAVGHVLIRDVDFNALKHHYLCGGIQDPEFPNVEEYSESILGFDELLEYLKPAPELIVYLDVKIEAGMTASAEAYAKAIFGRWARAGMRNKLYVEAPTAEILATYRRYAIMPFSAVLSYPPLSQGDNWITVGLSALRTVLHPSRPLNLVTQADAVASPVEVMTAMAQEKLQNNGKEVIVFTLNDHKAIDDACKSGVDLIITDYPNLGPCS